MYNIFHMIRIYVYYVEYGLNTICTCSYAMNKLLFFLPEKGLKGKKPVKVISDSGGIFLAETLNPLRADLPSPLLEAQGFKNISDMFGRVCANHPEKVYTLYKIEKGSWGSKTYSDIRKGMEIGAAAFLKLGIKKGDRITFVCDNRYEWLMTDLSLHRIGAINITNYVTPDPEKLVKSEIAFNINNSGARIALVAEKYLPKFMEIFDQKEIPTIEKIVVLDSKKKKFDNLDIMTHEAFLDIGRKNRKMIEDYDVEVELNDLATIIYTSGSTGVPKGVMLTHGNILSNVENIITMVDLRNEDIELSFLPLGHVFERVINYLLMRVGGTIGYAESITTIADDARVIKPTVFPAVPRVFEKFKAKVEDNARGKGNLSFKIYKWSTRIGSRVSSGETGFLTMLQYKIAKKIVFDKVVEKLGGHVRFFVSSSAPLSEDTAKFFKSMNLEILEAYGMTEAGPLISVNKNGKGRIGTVGEFIPELTWNIADDGEILIKSPSIMKGFWKNPEAEKEAFTDGWLATGDIGNVSKDGYLKITDRKKNMIKTSNGKYVPPAPIEDKLISNEYISQAVVIGDMRPHCSAIIVPDFQRLEDYAQKNKIHVTSAEELVKNPQIVKMFNDVVLKETKSFAHHEQPKKVILHSQEWTWEGGELTPTQKVKRSIILKKFKPQIEKLYTSLA